MEEDTIDLRSDTVTRPSPGMRTFMSNARVGDDAYGEDPSVISLEEYAADLLGKEAALFVPSGTMANQIALRVSTHPGDEVITEEGYHVHYFESACCVEISRVVLHPLVTNNGVPSAEHVSEALLKKPRSSLYSKPAVLSLENTIMSRAGSLFPLPSLMKLRELADTTSLSIHLDGARLFNASIASCIHPRVYAAHADTVMICCSKGLGAPFGSLLLANKTLIGEARRIRKLLGGALHQAGIMAAAALYALQFQRDRLEEDHEHARRLARRLIEEFEGVVWGGTNLVMLDVTGLGISAEAFASLARDRGVLVFPWTGNKVRCVTHLNLTTRDIDEAATRLCLLACQLKSGHSLAEPTAPAKAA